MLRIYDYDLVVSRDEENDNKEVLLIVLDVNSIPQAMGKAQGGQFHFFPYDGCDIEVSFEGGDAYLMDVPVSIQEAISEFQEAWVCLLDTHGHIQDEAHIKLREPKRVEENVEKATGH